MSTKKSFDTVSKVNEINSKHSKTQKNNVVNKQINKPTDQIDKPTDQTNIVKRGRGRPRKIIINAKVPKQILLNDQLIHSVDQCELFNIISTYKESESYYITINKAHKIEIISGDQLSKEKNVDLNNENDLKKISNYANTEKISNKILQKILSGLVNNGKNTKAINKYKQDYEIEKSVLYVWLLPTDIESTYIVKIGYSKNLIKRKSELCKMFGVKDLLLLFCIEIKNEGYESHIHNHLKEHYKHLYIETEKMTEEKNEKNEKSKFCVETYKFDIILIITIMDILRSELIKTENYGKELDLRNNEIKLEIEKEQTKREEIKLKQLEIKLQLAQLEKTK